MREHARIVQGTPPGDPRARDRLTAASAAAPGNHSGTHGYASEHARESDGREAPFRGTYLCNQPTLRERRVNQMKSFETVFRSIGYQAVLYFVVGGLLFGSQPHVGTPRASLLSFYDGQSTRIYIATVILGFGVLGILWFSQALATA